MKRYKTKKWLTGLITVFILLFSSVVVYGTETQENPAGFTVEAIQSGNQVDELKSYFYLSLEADETQEFQVKLRSLQKEPVTVNLAISDAESTSLGVINYFPEKPRPHKSLKEPLSSFVSIQGETKVTLENFEEKTVTYTIRTPKEAFPGVKLGAIIFTKEKDKKEEEQAIATVYQYKIAVMLTEDEEDYDQGANLTLDKVKLTAAYGQRVIAARIDNDQPKVIKDGEMIGHITKKGDKKIIQKAKLNVLDVAPNSSFDFQIPLGFETLKPGEYTFYGKAEDQYDTWIFQEDFTITAARVTEVDQETIYKIVVPKWIFWIVLPLILVVILNIIYLEKREYEWRKVDQQEREDVQE